MYKNIYQTNLSPVLTLWVLADSWESYIEISNSGLLPSPPPPSFSVSTTVPCQLSRGCKSYFANHKIKDTPAPSKKPPATQARIMQLEKSLCRDNDRETNCLCPQKFHHLLQKIMVRRPLICSFTLLYIREWSVSQMALRIVWKLILDQWYQWWDSSPC